MPTAPAAAADDDGHAHVDGGKCTSWVDEALDAAGPEYDDVPRPGSCCDKDAKEAKEAARVRRILAAADPAARAAALRAMSDPSNVLAMPPTLDEEEGEGEDGDEDSDDLLTDSDDDDRMMPTLDPVLLEIQERRIREMRAAAARAAAHTAKASYVSAKETDLPRLIAEGPSRVVVHFTLDGSDESARIDEVLDGLAPGHPRTRFVRVRGAPPPGGSSLHASPMLATLGCGALPALVCFRRARVRRWSAGLDDFGGAEGFDEERVVRWLAAQGGALPGHPLAPKPKPRAGGEAGYSMYSSDDDDDKNGGYGGGGARGGGGGGNGSDDDEGYGGEGGDTASDGTFCGTAGEPCAQCGRRYPHQHFRALRHGDGGGKRGSDDDEDSD
jgi:hypothetical protein